MRMRFSRYLDPEGALRDIAPWDLNYDPSTTGDRAGTDRLRHRAASGAHTAPG
jgi:hypothetical protein